MSNETPPVADVSEQGCGRSSRAVVDGEERSRLAGHLAMLPGCPTAVPPLSVAKTTRGRPARRRRQPPRPGPADVRSTARCRDRRPGSPWRLENRRRIRDEAWDRRRPSHCCRGDGTGGWPAETGPPTRSGRATESRGLPARRGRRGALQSGPESRSSSSVSVVVAAETAVSYTHLRA